MQRSMVNTSITSLYGSLPSSVVFTCKTETFGPELQVSVGPRPHLSFCAGKTACLASESLVSMGSRPHLWIWIAIQRLLVQNFKSLWVPHLTCGLWKKNSVIITRNTSLYASQASSVVYASKTATSGPELQVSIGTTLHLSFCLCKTA